MNAKKFKKLRSDLGLSQEEMADELNVSQPTIFRWESGDTDIPKIAWPAIEALQKRVK